MAPRKQPQAEAQTPEPAPEDTDEGLPNAVVGNIGADSVGPAREPQTVDLGNGIKKESF